MARPKQESTRQKLTTTIDQETMRILDLFGSGKRGLTIDWMLKNLSDEAKKKIEKLDRKDLFS